MERHSQRPPTRWEAAAELVPEGSRVAEIGADRAGFARLLLACGRVDRVLACDRRRDFDAGSRDVRGLELRRGEGLAPLRAHDGIEVLALLGLGARKIARILGHGSLAVLAPRRLVLQPQTEPGLLRTWLAGRGFALADERLALERGRFYVVLAAEAGAPEPPRPAGLDETVIREAGPWLLARPDRLAKAYWTREHDRAAGDGRRDLARRVLLWLERHHGGTAWYTPRR